MDQMATLEREFYRNARGQKPADQDARRLICDQKTRRLFVLHEWQTDGNAGTREYPIEEYVAAHGVAADALVDVLFKRLRVHA